MAYPVVFDYDMKEEAIALSINGVKRGLFDLEAAQALHEAMDKYLIPDEGHWTEAQREAWYSIDSAVSIMKKLEE